MAAKKGETKLPVRRRTVIVPADVPLAPSRSIPGMTMPALYRCPKGHVVDENPCPTHKVPSEPY